MLFRQLTWLNILLALIVFAASKPSLAQDGVAVSDIRPQSGKQYVIHMGGGAIIKPKYPGADKNLVYPFPIISVGRFFVPGVGQVVDGQKVKRGFNIYPSFDFNGVRKASDSPDLIGTTEVDWAFELGVGVGYRYDWIRGFFELRQGFNGHTGQVAELGLDFIANPTDRLEFRFGPRATWGSNNYMDTYFGVTPAEAASPGSILNPFNAQSGLKTVGVAAIASYALSEVTTLHFRGTWDRFTGDAKDSPIVQAGKENQYSLGAGITYRFAFDVF